MLYITLVSHLSVIIVCKTCGLEVHLLLLVKFVSQVQAGFRPIVHVPIASVCSGFS